MLAREALPPILLPNSQLYLKTRSVVQKPVWQQSIFVHASGAFPFTA